jgi:hypothetical protein
MKHSRRYTKTSDGNKHNNSTSTRKNRMSTSKVSTSDERTDIRIPKNSKIYQYLYVDNTIINIPIWKRLDALLSVAEQTREDLDTQIFETFVSTLGKLHPDKIDKIKKLRALILWHILWDEPLDEGYYEKLREL